MEDLNNPDGLIVEHAQTLLKLASETPGIAPKMVCFIAARILREEGHEPQVFSQVIFHDDNTIISNEVYLNIGNRLVDQLGIYENTHELAADRLKRWNLLSARSDDCPYPYDPDNEDDQIYAGFGYSPEATAGMLDLLRAEVEAQRMKQDAPGASARSSQKRL